MLGKLGVWQTLLSYATSFFILNAALAGGNQSKQLIDLTPWIGMEDPVLAVLEDAANSENRYQVLQQLVPKSEIRVTARHLVIAAIQLPKNPDRRIFDLLFTRVEPSLNELYSEQNILEIAMVYRPLRTVPPLLTSSVAKNYSKATLLQALKTAREKKLPAWEITIESLLTRFFDYSTLSAIIGRTIEAAKDNAEIATVALIDLVSHRGQLTWVETAHLESAIDLGLKEGQLGRRIFNILVEEGAANLNGLGRNNKTVLQQAIDEGEIDTLKELLREPAISRFQALTTSNAYQYAVTQGKIEFASEIMLRVDQVANRLKYEIRWHGYTSNTHELIDRFYRECSEQESLSKEAQKSIAPELRLYPILEFDQVMNAAVETKNDPATALTNLLRAGFPLQLKHLAKLIRRDRRAFRQLVQRKVIDLNAKFQPENISLIEYAIQVTDLPLLRFLLRPHFRQYYRKSTVENALQKSWGTLPIFTDTIVREIAVPDAPNISPLFERYTREMNKAAASEYWTSYWIDPIGTVLDSMLGENPEEVIPILRDLIQKKVRVREKHIYRAAAWAVAAQQDGPLQLLVRAALSVKENLDLVGREDSALELAVMNYQSPSSPSSPHLFPLPASPVLSPVLSPFYVGNEHSFERSPSLNQMPSSSANLWERGRSELNNLMIIQHLLREPLRSHYSRQTFASALHLARPKSNFLRRIFETLLNEPVQVETIDLLASAKLADPLSGPIFFDILVNAPHQENNLNQVMREVETPPIDFLRVHSRGARSERNQGGWEARELIEKLALDDDNDPILTVILKQSRQSKLAKKEVTHSQALNTIRFLIQMNKPVLEHHLAHEMHQVREHHDTTLLKILAHASSLSATELDNLLRRHLSESDQDDLMRRAAETLGEDSVAIKAQVAAGTLSLSLAILRELPPLGLLDVAVVERDEELFQTLMSETAAASFTINSIQRALNLISLEERDGLISVCLQLRNGGNASLIKPAHLLDAIRLAQQTKNSGLLNQLLDLEGVDINRREPSEAYPDGASILDLAVEESADPYLLAALVGGRMRFLYKSEVVKTALDRAREWDGDGPATQFYEDLYRDVQAREKNLHRSIQLVSSGKEEKKDEPEPVPVPFPNSVKDDTKSEWMLLSQPGSTLPRSLHSLPHSAVDPSQPPLDALDGPDSSESPDSLNLPNSPNSPNSKDEKSESLDFGEDRLEGAGQFSTANPELMDYYDEQLDEG